MTSVDLRGVSCGYGAYRVLSDVEFSFGSGEVVALIGANGSGKTTLMKTIAGALRPIAGVVAIGGQDVHKLSQRNVALQVGYVPQIESPAFDFSVREVVLMGRTPHSDGLYETKEDHEAAERAMTRAECVDLRDRPMSELSGGEGQRVRIARALAQETPVLLMDEPTTHLDVRHQIDIGRLVRDLAGDGKAVLVAVHDLNWAAAFATRAIVLGQGRVMSDALMGDVLESGILDAAFDVTFLRVREKGLRLFADEGS